MARKTRLQYEGAIHHVTFRGNARADIFLDDADRERMMESLAERVESYQVRLYLYCLMSNHVHLVVETPQGNLSAFMGSLLTSYTVYFNLRHRRAGHVTQGRYSSPVVEGDDYLLKLSRYVHLNPVQVRRAGSGDGRTNQDVEGIPVEQLPRVCGTGEAGGGGEPWTPAGDDAGTGEREEEGVPAVCGGGLGGDG